jgi:hypothetical protein
MKSEPQGRMSFFPTFAIIEEVGLDILKDREESAAFSVLDDGPVSTFNRTVPIRTEPISARGSSESEQDCERL